MAMKPENKFRKWFIERFQSCMQSQYDGVSIRVQKHADYATDGIPDLDISVNGMTAWIEVKCLDACKRERKINVTPLQRNNLCSAARAGVPSGLLVGLSLGPRKGYLVAFYKAADIPDTVCRDSFRDVEHVTSYMYSTIRHHAFFTNKRFTEQVLAHNEKRGASGNFVDFADLDVVVGGSLECPRIEPLLDQLQTGATPKVRGDELLGRAGNQGIRSRR